MALDLRKTALQIDQMALALKAQQGARTLRLQRAFEVFQHFDAADYERHCWRSGEVPAWNVPAVLGSPAACHLPPPRPDEFCIVGADGSDIAVDRHIPARCFVINVGVAVVRYGPQPDARLFNQPRLYAQEDELVIRDRDAHYPNQPIEGAVLGAKRTVEEARALLEAVRGLPAEIPTLALLDGSLIMLGLVGRGYYDFVRRELIQEGFAQAMEDLKQMAGSRPVALASYISLPGHTEVVKALGAEDLLDREIFAEILEPGERSAIFASASLLVDNYYRGHGVYFFYVNAGQEIGRVEVPSWVVRDEASLGLVHSLIIDQCRRGPGYPVALMEAHEQAVITGPDRQHFVQLVENALAGQQLPVHFSEKGRSKRGKWL